MLNHAAIFRSQHLQSARQRSSLAVVVMLWGTSEITHQAEIGLAQTAVAVRCRAIDTPAPLEPRKIAWTHLVLLPASTLKK